ncbi:hypothetical protein QUF72_13490 [Desulfobacterales bacterium HSG2]|nr:hypothetical protein [Desulfobacterales bacterium HSG2]
MIFVWAASLGLDWQIQARLRICQSVGSRVLRLAETKIKARQLYQMLVADI